MVFIAARVALTVSDGFPFTGCLDFVGFPQELIGCYWLFGIIGILLVFQDIGRFCKDSLDSDIFFRYWISVCS
jgi:hypothetical protein